MADVHIQFAPPIDGVDFAHYLLRTADGMTAVELKVRCADRATAADLVNRAHLALLARIRDEEGTDNV